MRNASNQILAVINQYVAGGNISGEMAKKAFHPNAIVNAEPAQGLYDAIDQAGPGESVARVGILDGAGNIACARVVMENWHGQNFVDFHQLMKMDDGWKIVSKIYQAYPAHLKTHRHIQGRSLPPSRRGRLYSPPILLL